MRLIIVFHFLCIPKQITALSVRNATLSKQHMQTLLSIGTLQSARLIEIKAELRLLHSHSMKKLHSRYDIKRMHIQSEICLQWMPRWVRVGALYRSNGDNFDNNLSMLILFRYT